MMAIDNDADDDADEGGGRRRLVGWMTGGLLDLVPSTWW